MKQEEKSARSRQRILEAAMEEFSQKVYEGASLNSVWAKKGISKGIIYHHFKDKDELYLLCVESCFQAVTSHLQAVSKTLTGAAKDQLQDYFDARIGFFADNPRYLGIFVDASFHPPEKLRSEISRLREPFDTLNISVLTELLKSQPLRQGLSVDLVVTDFRMYMDYFNVHFKTLCGKSGSSLDILRKHEELCHRQLDILLYVVLDKEK